MIANGLYEICLNRLKELKNGYICCKAFPDGVPSGRYCSIHCDLEFMDETKKLPEVTCPNGCRLEIRKGYFEDLREYAKTHC